MFHDISLKKVIEIRAEAKTRQAQSAADFINYKAGAAGFMTAFDFDELNRSLQWFEEQIEGYDNLKISKTEVFIDKDGNRWEPLY